MLSELIKVKEWYIEEKTKKDYLEKAVNNLGADLERVEKRMSLLQLAREKLSVIGIETQNKVKGFMEGSVNKGLKEVMGQEYEFKIDFQVNRNQPEAFLSVLKNDLPYILNGEETGGGLLDVVSLLMRLVIWAMKPDRTSGFFALDEPFKFLDEDKFDGVGCLLKELRDQMGIQFLIVSHDEEIVDLADRVWECIQGRDGVSELKEI